MRIAGSPWVVLWLGLCAAACGDEPSAAVRAAEDTRAPAVEDASMSFVGDAGAQGDAGDTLEKPVDTSVPVPNTDAGLVESKQCNATNWEQYLPALSGCDLAGVDLTGRQLREVDLSFADLSGADLSFADLGGADLTGADLGGANLASTNLSGADLSGADLRDAYLGRATVDGADFGGANLAGADTGRFDGGCPAVLPSGWLCLAAPGAAFPFSVLLGPGAKLHDLGGFDLGGADLSGADLGEANTRH